MSALTILVPRIKIRSLLADFIFYVLEFRKKNTEFTEVKNIAHVNQYTEYVSNLNKRNVMAQTAQHIVLTIWEIIGRKQRFMQL